MRSDSVRRILITGGGGFIGSNLASRLLSNPNTHVRVFDNFSRRGIEANLAWLRSLAGQARLEIVRGDVRDARAVEQAARDVSEIYHLAGQVAVTSSVDDPQEDFEINAGGTLHVLEAARRSTHSPFFFFTSTNKVYGALESVQVAVEGDSYRAQSGNFRGVDESQPLDFYSPYGCSKGAADQYVRDYARIYHLPAVVFRMSCIAGPRQLGTEDQGWVAHFIYSVLSGRPITVYGNGRQVRDVLHVHDLIDAIAAIRAALDRTRGEIYNVGGGPRRAISVLQMLQAIERRTGKPVAVRYREIRPGDQSLYISDTEKMERHTGWRPRRSIQQTIDSICDFWRDNQEHFRNISERRLPETKEQLQALPGVLGREEVA